MANVASFRPDKKFAKIAYTVLKTPKQLQQTTDKQPTQKMIQEWHKDSQTGP